MKLAHKKGKEDDGETQSRIKAHKKLIMFILTQIIS